MTSAETVQEFADQFGSNTFTSLVERRLRQNWSNEQIQMGMRGMYANFPPDCREALDDYLHHYVERWFVPAMQTQEMRIVFLASAEDLRNNAPIVQDASFVDARIIDMFNIMMMKVTRLANNDVQFRRMWRIKKAWWDLWLW